MNPLLALALVADDKTLKEIHFPAERLVATSLVVLPGANPIVELKFTSLKREVNTIAKKFARFNDSRMRDGWNHVPTLAKSGQYFVARFPLGTGRALDSSQDFSRSISGCMIRAILFAPGAIEFTVDQWRTPQELRHAFPDQSFLQSESLDAIEKRKSGKFDLNGVRFFISSTSNGIVDSVTGRLSFVKLSLSPKQGG